MALPIEKLGTRYAERTDTIDPDRPHHVKPFGHISEQFDPGGDGAGSFPRVQGWALPAG